MKFKKKMKEIEKYSFISVSDLENLQNKALHLADELKSIDIVKEHNLYKSKLNEYITIVSDLRKYKKYAKYK